MNATETPRIYVACLASYNNGVLHGRWIDAVDESEIQEEVAAMLRESRYPNVQVECPECEGCDDDCDECKGTGTVPSAEEWAIHDHEGFHGVSISEHDSFDDIAELAQLIEEHGPAYAAYADLVGADNANGPGFQDKYCGEFGSEQEYAEQLIDDCYNIKEMMGNLSFYFDYEKFARDLFINDYTSQDSPEGGIFVFRR